MDKKKLAKLIKNTWAALQSRVGKYAHYRPDLNLSYKSIKLEFTRDEAIEASYQHYLRRTGNPPWQK
jgi:hypothetical protein